MSKRVTRGALIVLFAAILSGCGRPLVHNTSVHVVGTSRHGESIVRVCAPEQPRLDCIEGTIGVVSGKAHSRWDLTSAWADLDVQLARVKVQER